MRAREFIREQREEMPAEQKFPMHDTYIIPGIRNNDVYHAYRFGAAIARARAEEGGQDQHFPDWASQSVFGQNAVVSGFDSNVEAVIDRALKMTDTPGGKILIGSKDSEEPPSVDNKSPVKPFKGYPR